MKKVGTCIHGLRVGKGAAPCTQCDAVPRLVITEPRPLTEVESRHLKVMAPPWVDPRR